MTASDSIVQPMMTLDLRQTKCPLNFVQTRLALEKIAIGAVLEIWILAEGESAVNIPNSIAQDGHQVIKTATESDGKQILWIQRAK